MPDTPSATSATNAWPGWDIQVLHDLGAPTSKFNIAFLDEWQSYEQSKAKNNPLNLTAPHGTGSINSAGVQNYATQQQAAQLTANNIRNYPTIYNMLKSDNVKGTLLDNGKLQDLVKELNHWGSKSFASNLAGNESVVTKTENAVTAPFHDLTSAWDWVSNNWSRILFVIGGSVLVIIGLIVILRNNKQNTFTFQRGDS